MHLVVAAELARDGIQPQADRLAKQVLEVVGLEHGRLHEHGRRDWGLGRGKDGHRWNRHSLRFCVADLGTIG